MNSSHFYNPDLPEIGPYDVLVCGGGPGGFPAALAAARQGLKVLLIESKHALGGTGTTGMVSHWLGGRSDQGQWVIGGIFRELSQQAAKAGIAVIPDPSAWANTRYSPYGIHKGQLLAGIPFEPLGMATLIERTLVEAGVDLLFEAAAVDLIREGRQVTHVIVASKAGLTAVRAKAVIDATGDADVAAFAGCRYEKGDEEGYLTGVSLIMHLDGVDEDALMTYVTREDDSRFRKLMADLESKGIDCLNYQIIIFVKLNEDGYFMINGRALEDVDGTDPLSRSRAYVAERGKIPRVMELFRQHFPGCAGIRLRAVASNLGVRETRRIHGMGYMSVADVIEGKPFPDTIGFSAYSWDLGKRGVQPMHGVQKPPIIPIPYGVMVPEGLDNVICPGRAVHVERPVLGPLRVQAPIMAMGQAAGTASAQVVRSQRTFAEVDVPALRQSLQEAGAIIESH